MTRRTGRITPGRKALPNDGTASCVTYTNGKQYPYGDRVRLYDQVERRKVDASMRSACGSAGTTSRSLRARRGSPRAIRAATPRIGKLTARFALRRYGSDEVRGIVLFATPEQRKTVSILDYVREEARAQARSGRATLEQSGTFLIPGGGRGRIRTGAAILTERLGAWFASAARLPALKRSSSRQIRPTASDHLTMPFHSNIDQRSDSRRASPTRSLIIDGPLWHGQDMTISTWIASSSHAAQNTPSRRRSQLRGG